MGLKKRMCADHAWRIRPNAFKQQSSKCQRPLQIKIYCSNWVALFKWDAYNFGRVRRAWAKLPEQHKMSIDTLQSMSDSGAKMKSQYLSRRLAKEKTQCPGCNKILQVGTLAWSHRCRVAKHVPEEVAQQRLEKMREAAAESFRKRQEAQGQQSSESPTVQADPVTQE